MLLLEVLITGIIRGIIYSLMALGFSLIFGVTEVCDFAYGEYAMIGSYIAFFVVKVSRNPFLAIISAMVGTFLVGVITEFFTVSPLRERGGSERIEAIMIGTIGLSMFLKNSAQVILSPEYKIITYFKGSLNILGVSIGYDRLYATLFAIIILVILIFFINKTMMGKSIRAISQDIEAAAVMGINPKKYFYLVHGLGSMLAGAGGSLLLPIYLAYPTVGVQYIMISFTIVIFGGLGNIEGTVLGSLLLGIIESFVMVYFVAEYMEFISFFILVLILLIKPSGLFGRELRT